MRLIDADAAYEFARTSGIHNDLAHSLADLTSLRELLDDCDTVDAVEVVRCRECKKYFKIIGRDEREVWGCRYFGATVKPNDFCSYGKRKDGDG